VCGLPKKVGEALGFGKLKEAYTGLGGRNRKTDPSLQAQIHLPC
jgi:hypothetical protein